MLVVALRRFGRNEGIAAEDQGKDSRNGKSLAGSEASTRAFTLVRMAKGISSRKEKAGKRRYGGKGGQGTRLSEGTASHPVRHKRADKDGAPGGSERRHNAQRGADSRGLIMTAK